MISHKYKCILIHIPKCAGTSIEKAFGHLDSYSGWGEQDHRSIRMIENPLFTFTAFSTRENIRDIIRRIRHKYGNSMNPNNKISLTKEEYWSYYKFAIVRNPWARAFSWYKNVMEDERHKKSYRITKDKSLKDFLKKYSGKGMLRPQTYWLKSFDGSIKMDFIGRFERITEDFQKICNDINAPQMTLPHKLKGSGEDYRKYYDDESVDIIATDYREEISLFNYSF